MPKSAPKSEPGGASKPPDLVPCPDCFDSEGTGFDCLRCLGSGWIQKSKHQKAYDVIQSLGFELLDAIRKTIAEIRDAEEMGLDKKAIALRTLAEAATAVRSVSVEFRIGGKDSS